jgi:hypothetical protein
MEAERAASERDSRPEAPPHAGRCIDGGKTSSEVTARLGSVHGSGPPLSRLPYRQLCPAYAKAHRPIVEPPPWPHWRVLGLLAYRIYRVSQDGHFLSAEDVECADDQEATKKARQGADHHDVELWERDRFIVRVLHKG